MVLSKMSLKTSLYRFILYSFFAAGACLDFRRIPSTLENVYSYSISESDRHIYEYNIKTREMGQPLRHSIRFTTSVPMPPQNLISNSSGKCPLLFDLKMGNTLDVWRVYPDKNSSFMTVERTVCIDKEIEDESYSVTVEVSTCSKIPLKYTLVATMKRDFTFGINQPKTANLIAGSPELYMFRFPNRTGDLNPSEFAFIQLTSSSNACMLMSVQSLQCPIFESEQTIPHKGHWQTVTTKTGMSLRRSQYPDGFFVVLLLLPDDSRCQALPERSSLTPELNTSRSKSISFTIRDDIPVKNYNLGLLIPFGAFMSLISFVFVIHLAFDRYRRKLILEEMSKEHSESRSSNESESSDNSSGPKLHATFQDYRVFIADLINSPNPERLMVQSRRYFVAGILVTTFYCVPVFQLIFSFYSQLRETGNFDLCYFNYLCSHTIEIFHDFNHIYSNIGYVICGFFYMCLVFQRRTSMVITVWNESSLSTSKWPISFTESPSDISKGVFLHHGLLYAIGFSLFMTGVMSAGYHVCPNQNNFQFDTPFMYTTVALGIVTIYQFRHPSYVSASATFMSLAVVAASTVLGLLWESLIFLLSFTIIHVVFLLFVLTYIYYVGYVRVNTKAITEWRQIFRVILSKWKDDYRSGNVLGIQRDVWFSPTDPNVNIVPGPCRLLFPILALMCNTLAMGFVWIVLSESNFASQVLTVYVMNASCYLTYYVFMKAFRNECRHKLFIQPLIYIVISFCLWTYSLTYYGDEVTVWEKSPAESRAKNVECTFLGMYDSHDVWHFTSAAALFSSMMVLLTVDDDVVLTPKSKIHVF